MKLSFIGSGNVAWHLAQAFENTNHHSVLEVYSRSITNAKKLCGKLYNALPTNSLNLTESKAEIFFICVPDDAIETVCATLKLPKDCIVLHTAGSKGLEALEGLMNVKIGVFYPLQTFSKAKAVNFENIPICIELEDKLLEKSIEKLAFSICENVAFVNSNDRKVLHLAAVFACNFTNHLFSIAKNIVERENLEFKILQPLIEETIQKALANGPEKSQTGPAARKDDKTIQMHLKMLDKYTEIQTIYQIMTENIQNKNFLSK
ncbi:MAG: Rossmann-like and DUF2520 domain-containing protein [Cytophagales bacterium]